MSTAERREHPRTARIAQLIERYRAEGMRAVVYHSDDPNAEAIREAATAAGLIPTPDPAIPFRTIRGESMPRATAPPPTPSAGPVAEMRQILRTTLEHIAGSLVPAVLSIAEHGVQAAYERGLADGRQLGPVNVHCSTCGGTRGGPPDHKTDECTWVGAR